jgi:hypothetical protein
MTASDTGAASPAPDLLDTLAAGPAAIRGVRWDDLAFGIEWPETGGELIISERDAAHPDFTA